MGPPPDKDMLMGPPPAPLQLSNGSSSSKLRDPGLADKYSRLKKKYFELEQVRVPRLLRHARRLV